MYAKSNQDADAWIKISIFIQLLFPFLLLLICFLSFFWCTVTVAKSSCSWSKITHYMRIHNFIYYLLLFYFFLLPSIKCISATLLFWWVFRVFDLHKFYLFAFYSEFLLFGSVKMTLKTLRRFWLLWCQLIRKTEGEVLCLVTTWTDECFWYHQNCVTQ